ncbi:hypothetical protein RI054_38g141660 [Pseudoscourfieldia marina]
MDMLIFREVRFGFEDGTFLCPLDRITAFAANAHALEPAFASFVVMFLNYLQIGDLRIAPSNRGADYVWQAYEEVGKWWELVNNIAHSVSSRRAEVLNCRSCFLLEAGRFHASPALPWPLGTKQAPFFGVRL